MRPINGKLKDYDFQSLMDKVKERKESLFTVLEHNDKLYDFTIRTMEFVTPLDDNTLWQFYCVESDEEDDRYLSDYKECSNLLEKDLVIKMDEYRNRIIDGEFDRR